MTVSTGELLPANAEILDGVDNLSGLGYLNEPSVLCNLQYRYHRDVIYVCIYFMSYLYAYIIVVHFKLRHLQHCFMFADYGRACSTSNQSLQRYLNFWK